MEPISMIVAAVLLACSAAGGFSLGRRRRRRDDGAEQPICTCTHGLAFHDPDTNKCHGTVNGRASEWSGLTGRPIAWYQVPCQCRQYVGPIPADRMLSAFSVRHDPDLRNP